MTARGSAAAFRSGAVGLAALVEYRRDVLKRGDRHLDRRTEHDFGGANGRGIGRVGNRKAIISVWRANGENRRLPQKPARKSVETWCRGQELRQTEAHRTPIVGHLVGEFGCGKIGCFPQFPQGTRDGSIGRVFDAGARLCRQGIFFQKVLPEGLCGQVAHRIPTANLVTGMQQLYDSKRRLRLTYLVAKT